MRTALCAAMLAALAIAPASAETKTKNYIVKQGTMIPVGSYYQINTKTCQAGPIPKIVQTSKPTIGKLIIEETKVEPSQKECKAFLVPGYKVRFEAGPKTGEEKVTYDVVYESKTLGTWNVVHGITVQ